MFIFKVTNQAYEQILYTSKIAYSKYYTFSGLWRNTLLTPALGNHGKEDHS